MIQLRCLFGMGKFHDLESKGIEFQGVTLGWDAQPARAYRERFQCKHCGQNVMGGLTVIYGELKLWPELYDFDGWPKDDYGNRAPMIMVTDANQGLA